MRKQHLDLLPFVPGSLELRRSNKLTGVIAGLFVDAALDIARWHVWTASRLELAGPAVLLRCSVLADAVMGAVGARHRVVAPELLQHLSRRTDVLVLFGIKDEVGSVERPVVPIALIPNRDVRFDLLVDQPSEELAGPIGGVGGEPLRLRCDGAMPSARRAKTTTT